MDLPHELFIKQQFDFISLPNNIIDLIDVIGLIYIGDISTKKINPDEKRVLDINAPVTDPELWNNNIALLQKLIKFTSGDDIDIRFTYQQKEIKSINMSFENDTDYQCITLLSGGLDSFCGSYINYENKINSIYVSYRNNVNDVASQYYISLFLKNKIENFCEYAFNKINIKKEEPSQRTRSLLYMSLAVIVAASNSINEIRIYENGIMSLNPSLYGRHTTKTTHPKTIFIFNNLLHNLSINVDIINPCVFHTKGEMVNNIENEFIGWIKQTWTCSVSRQNRYVDDRQCGFCVPCLLRKISLSAYDLEEYDAKYKIDYGVKLNQIKERYIRNHYKSSVEYFRKFMELINNEEIYPYLEIKKDYFTEKEYYLNLNRLFFSFSAEIERYLNKYELY